MSRRTSGRRAATSTCQDSVRTYQQRTDHRHRDGRKPKCAKVGHYRWEGAGMHKRTVAIVLMATTTFTMIPFFWQWINFQYGRHLYADWSAWWSFGTFLLAVIAACLTWQEYHASRRPRLMVKLTKSYHHLVTGEIAESVHFLLRILGDQWQSV